MTRTMKTGTWRLAMLMLTALYLGTNAWAQSSGGSTPGVSSNEPQVAQPPEGGVNWKGVGVGAGTIVTNLVYVPAKLVYGILGGIGGAAGYALTGGNKQVADSIWRSSLGGDYVLTPDMLTGDAPIHFSGPPNPVTQPAPAETYSSTPPPAVASSSPPVYPSPPASSSAPSSNTSSAANGVGAPPLSSHFNTSITGPGDSGTGPVHEHDIE
jgi:hypothetical protein